MSSGSDRVDALIADVARGMTDASPRDLAGDIGARLRLRARPRGLVPAMVATAIVLAAGVGTLLLQPAGPKGPILQARTDDARRLVVEPSGLPGPKGPGLQSVDVGQLGLEPPSLPGSKRPGQRTSRGAAGQQALAAQREMLPPPFVSDLSPAPLHVASIPLPPVTTADDIAPPPLTVDPLHVPPIDERGGSR